MDGWVDKWWMYVWMDGWMTERSMDNIVKFRLGLQKAFVLVFVISE